MTNDREAVARLPCPFCGTAPLVCFSHEAGQWDIYEVECVQCNFSLAGPVGFEGDNAARAAIAAWNTRTPPASEPSEAVVDAAMKAFGDTELVGSSFTRRAVRAAIVAAIKAAEPSSD